jgi:hypothetical protein
VGYPLAMRDQYAGDINDVVKFALLRALVGTDRKLGIAWYYVPGDDGSQDGRHLEWRDEEAWRRFDEELHAGLATLPERSIASLEQAEIWPKGVLFHRVAVPLRRDRSAWGIRKRSELDSADVVFLDPDIGVGEETESYATFSEVRLLRRTGRAVIFISFPKRTNHLVQVNLLHDRLKIHAGTQSVITLRTVMMVPTGKGSRVPRMCWFTMLDWDAELLTRAQTFRTRLASVPYVTMQLDIAA